MIVCVCNNVSDGKIRQAVADGATSLLQLRTQLEVGTCCGKCHACAKNVLQKCIAESRPQAIMFHTNALAA